MLRRRIQQKIHHLRQQPEAVRLRAASLMTAGAGVALIVLWLGVLLPVQLAWSRRGDQEVLPEQELLQRAAETAPDFNFEGTFSDPGRVGGVRTESPTPTPPIFNLAPAPTATLVPPTPLSSLQADLPTDGPEESSPSLPVTQPSEFIP